MNGKDARVNLVKSFYATCRTNGMTASRALEFARARAKRYAEEIEQLPFGRERSALHKSLWPKARRWVYFNPQSKNGHRWIENASAGLRVKAAHDVIILGHTGWYVREFGETVHGAVIQLPARNGKPRYYPAVSDAWNDDCYWADMRRLYDEESDCARNADIMAESYAEEQREYSEADQMGQSYAGMMEEAAEARKAALELIRDFKAEQAEGKSARPSICAAIRQSIKSEVHTWQSNKAQAFKLVAGLYYSPDSRAERWRELWAVFAESAGIKTPKRA